MKDKSEIIFKWMIISSTIIFTLIVCTFLIKNYIGEKYLVAFIGFSGSILGGFLTLIGVKWTLDEQKRKENKKRYEKANFVFSELLPDLIAVYNSIKSLNP